MKSHRLGCNSEIKTVEMQGEYPCDCAALGRLSPAQRPLSKAARDRLDVILRRIDFLTKRITQRPAHEENSTHFDRQERSSLRWAVRIICDLYPELSVEPCYTMEDQP